MNNKQKKKLISIAVSLIIIAAITIIEKYGDQFFNEKSPARVNEIYSNTKLAELDYEIGTNPIIAINNNQSELDINDWASEIIHFSPLDTYNRVGGATAFLSKKNLGKSLGRESQRFTPTGWSNQPKTIQGSRIYPQNRGHLIAYTLSFNFSNNGEFQKGELGSIDNPKNLFTQSEFSNQQLMTIYEEKVRQALKDNKKVIYQVTPIFRNNELMARGVWLQAISTNKALNFNVYIFNVQEKIRFDYVTGKSVVDKSMTIGDYE